MLVSVLESQITSVLSVPADSVRCIPTQVCVSVCSYSSAVWPTQVPDGGDEEPHPKVAPGRPLVPAKLGERFEVLHLRIPRFLRLYPHRVALFLPVAPAVHLVVDEANRLRNRE